jgi:hypothetical protein
MGFLDFLFKRDAGGAGGEANLLKHAERVLDKRAMSPDRFASIEYLCNLATEDAWRALLPRYNFVVDPSITDREEKQFIFDRLSRAPESAVVPVKEFLRKTTSVNWAIKMLREIVPAEEYVTELLDVLQGEGTAYQKNADRKINAIMALEDALDPRITPALLGFLEDVSEDVRFHTVRTLLAQGDVEAAAGPLAALLGREESMRIKTNIADGLAEKAWAVPEDHRERTLAVLPRLPTGPYAMDAQGIITRRG